MTGPRDCPRWEGCGAPVCPLAHDWQRAQHLDGERVCGLLCELAKDGGEARLRAALSMELVDRLATVGPKVAARWERVRKRLRESARTGSRMAAGQRLAQGRGGAVMDAPATPSDALEAVGATVATGHNAARGASGEGA